MSKLQKYNKKSYKIEGPLCTSEEKLPKNILTPGQEEAYKLFNKWYKNRKNGGTQILRIGGASGTGKTVLVRYIIERYNFTASDCYVMAYTGQAVNVLRKNCIMARTIHSTIMIPNDEIIYDKETGEPITRRGVPLTRVRFRPVKSLPKTVKLLIVDEASFLPGNMERILKRYNIPILEIGDPIQLPPVGAPEVFTLDKLDYFMEGVMRQRKDSEILKLANRIRANKNVYPQDYTDDVRFLMAQSSIERTFYKFLPFFRDADVIVTTTNKQRQIITDLYRKEIIGTNSPFPREGERMICRKNNQLLFLGQYMLTNGTQGVCMNTVAHSDRNKTEGVYMMNFKPDVVANDPELYYDNLVCDEEYLRRPFGTDNLVSFQHPGEKFEYAHAITAHLVQGSQFPTVLFMDSYSHDPEYIRRLRYTAITRAQERLWYILPYNQNPNYCPLSHVEEE